MPQNNHVGRELFFSKPKLLKDPSTDILRIWEKCLVHTTSKKSSDISSNCKNLCWEPTAKHWNGSAHRTKHRPVWSFVGSWFSLKTIWRLLTWWWYFTKHSKDPTWETQAHFTRAEASSKAATSYSQNRVPHLLLYQQPSLQAIPLKHRPHQRLQHWWCSHHSMQKLDTSMESLCMNLRTIIPAFGWHSFLLQSFSILRSFSGELKLQFPSLFITVSFSVKNISKTFFDPSII